MTDLVALSPEQIDIANAYLQFGSAKETAYQLQVPEFEVIKILERSDVKDYITGVYLDRGYRNRNKLGALLDRIIDSKVAEAEESEVYSNKDLLEILKFAHQIRMDEQKLLQKEGPSTQVNIANIGDNYGKLIETLMK